MPHRDIIFGEYMPDKSGDPAAPVGYLIRASGVRPTANGYAPAPSFQEITSAAALAAAPVGAAGFSVSTNARHYAGTASNLYESDDEGVTWNTNSRGAGYTSASFWRFALFNDAVIAVNGFDAPQTKSVTGTVTTDFADLAGSPPVAGRVARIRDHVVLGNLSGVPHAFQTSAIGDHTDWPTVGSADALAKQSIYQELPKELGSITDIVGGEKYGLFFQQGGITRATYVGGDVVYQIDTFERARGTGLRGSAIRVGQMVYFMSLAGVYRTDGYAVQNLSAGKIEESLIKDLTSLTEGIDIFCQSVAYDSRFDRVMWEISTSLVTYVLSYYIGYDRFAIETIIGVATTVGTLYSVRSAASEESQEELVYAFNNSKKLCSFTKTTSLATLIHTGYVELSPGYVTQVEGIEPLGVRTAGDLFEIKSALLLSSIVTTTSGYTAADKNNRSEIARVRSTGRYHSLSWQATVGMDALFRGLRVHYKPVSRL